MANTVIQVKRSNSTSVPTNGSLTSGELAYSYLANVMFAGTFDGTGVIEVGGRHYVEKSKEALAAAQSAFAAANSVVASGSTDAYNTANLAFNTANLAFGKANAVGEAVTTVNTNVTGATSNVANLVGAINTANSNITAAFLKANQVGAAVTTVNTNVTGATSNIANLVGAITSANSNITASFLKANQVGEAVTTVNTNVTGATSNVANLVGAINTANGNITASFNKANAALPSTGGTITGDLSIVGNISVTGNTSFISVQNFKVDDALIYLAGNNYVSDIVDIGFIGNYVNATGSNVHTGLFRDHTTKEYYLFQGYDQEPINNHIDPNGNNFTIAILNTAVRTSNLILGGTNAIPWITSAFTTANAAFLKANQVGEAVTTVNTNVTGATSNVANLVGAINTANSSITAAFVTANLAFNFANTANVNAANASFLSTGTVPSARLSGSYTGITGVGTLTAGTWNADVITVPYGGTGNTTFTANGILYGNGTGPVLVTPAGTDGQILQSDQGVPKFAMLDGGSF